MTQAADIAAAAADRFEAYRVGVLSDLAQIAAIPDPTPPKPEFVLGQTMPGPGNCGRILGPYTKTVTAPTTISNSGVVTDTRFENWVDVTASWVRFVNCEFAGPATYSTPRPLVKCTSSNIKQATFSFCTFAARTPGPDEVDGIVGFNYRLDRCDLHHLDDGFGVHSPGNVVVTGCWIHDLVYFANAKQADGTHNDLFQVHNGGRLTVIGSRLDAYLTDGRRSMSAGMLSPIGTSLDLLIADCWVNGGQVAFNFGGWTTQPGERRLIGNRYGTDVTTAVLAKSTLPLILAGNTRDGLSFDVRRNG